MARTYDDRMFIETFEHTYTWLNGFLRNVRRFGNRNAILDPATGRQWTYRDLHADACRLAHALAEDGIGRSDVVMLVLANTPEFAVCYVGPRMIGAIINPVNYNLAPGELALLIDHNKPKAVVYSASSLALVTGALAMAQTQPRRVILADNISGIAVPDGHIAWEDYLAGRPTTAPVRDFKPHIYDEVLRLCTSGTTALPKSVPVNDINEVISAHDVIMQYPLEPHDVTMNTTPWFHRGGCHCGGPCPTFYVGACVVVCRSFAPRQTLKWVEEFGVTFLMGAPTSLEMLARSQDRIHADLSRLKGLVTMGSPLERAACERYQSVLTPRIFNGYGTTETFWNSFLRPWDLPEGAGSVGGSCIDDDVRVVNTYEDRHADPDDVAPMDGKTVGEVIISAPAKGTLTYFGNPEAAAKKFHAGWMYTGDAGTWTEDCHVTICGRRDDMILCSAENIHPAQIEEILNTCPMVDDCLVTGVPDPLRGQAVVAYIIPREGATIPAIAEFCRKSPFLSDYKCPRWYRLVDALPHTPTGKKQHYVLRKQAVTDLEQGLLIRA